MSAFGLTKRERDAVAFIKAFQEEHGGAGPSLIEIANGIGLTSKSGAHRIVVGLEDRGCVIRLKNRGRSIKLVDPAAVPDLPQPLLGRLLSYAAGAGIPPAAALNVLVAEGLDALIGRAILTSDDD